MEIDASSQPPAKEDGPSAIRTRSDFGRALTALRESAGLTVRDVAKATGLPVSTLGGYFSGRHLPPLKPFSVVHELLGALGVVNRADIETWRAVLARLRRSPYLRSDESFAPYRGLASFQPDDADWFFGRETLTRQLVSRLASAEGSITAVVGPSGCGKSSLLRAGLVASLRANTDATATRSSVNVLLLTPGERPMSALLDAWRAAVPEGAPSDLPPDERPLVIVVDQFEELYTQCADDEERSRFVNTVCALVDGRDSGVFGPPGELPKISLVFGLRADFYGHAARFERIAKALQESQIIVGAMSDAELRRAIIHPAQRAGFALEPGLVEVLLRDLGRHDDRPQEYVSALPLLSHALLSTWRRGTDGMLTVANYQATGGIRGAVAHTAEEVYLALTESEQSYARRLFLRLVNVGDDVTETRRAIQRAELATGRAGEVQRAVAEGVLESFVDHRLISADTDSIQISHEALLTAWPRLRRWIDNDRAGLRIQHRIRDAAAAWLDSGQGPDGLLRGTFLAVAVEWAQDPSHAELLNGLELEFLQASKAAEDELEMARKRTTRRLRRLTAGLSALLLIAGLTAIYAFEQRSDANRQRAIANQQRDSAVSRQGAIEANQLRTTDLALANQLALAAYRVDPTPEARASLLDTALFPDVTRVVGAPGVMQAVAVAHTGQLMATCGSDGALQLWRLSQAKRPTLVTWVHTHVTYTLFSVAFSPDGRTLAAAGAGGTLQLWDVTDPERPRPSAFVLAGLPAATVYGIAFSPDGSALAAASSDDMVRLWTLSKTSSGAAPRKLAGFAGFVQAVAFSPDGHALAAGSKDGTVRIWSFGPSGVTAGPMFSAARVGVFCVAFSPDGRVLAAGGKDGTVWLWQRVGSAFTSLGTSPLSASTGWINTIAFSGDGRTLVTAGSDSKTRLWSLSSGVPGSTAQAVLPGPAPVTGAVFLPDGDLATSSADATARLWRLPAPPLPALPGRIFSVVFGPRHLMIVGTESDSVSLWRVTNPKEPTVIGSGIVDPGAAPFSGTLAISPDGRLLAVGSNDGSVRLWNIADPARPVAYLAVLTGLSTAVETLAFSPDGRTLAAGANEADIRLWNVSNPRAPVGYPVLTGPGNYVFSLAFSPDGHLLAAGSADDTVRLWNITQPRQPRALGQPLRTHTSYVYSVAFSPDGRLLAVGSADDTVDIWDVTTPSNPKSAGPVLTGPDNYVYTVAFNNDGHSLAAAAGDGTVWLWNVADPGRPTVLAALDGSNQSEYTVGFEPGSSLLAAGGQGQIIDLWNTDPATAAADVCAKSGTPLSKSEWERYLPDKPYSPPCS